jgi:ATP-dependent DNA helicase RecG
METENTIIEYKSIRKVTSGDAGFKELAVTAVCLANTQGGRIIIGVEDKNHKPPPDQVISTDIMNKTVTRLRSLCFNVGLFLNEPERHYNGGEYFSITIQPTLKSLATTSDGKVFIRIGDQCQPARGEDILRIAAEKRCFSVGVTTEKYKCFRS